MKRAAQWRRESTTETLQGELKLQQHGAGKGKQEGERRVHRAPSARCPGVDLPKSSSSHLGFESRQEFESSQRSRPSAVAGFALTHEALLTMEAR